MKSETIPACAELAARSQRPHEPVEDLDQFPELLATLRDLPLSSTLQISPNLLTRKLRVRGVKDAILKQAIEQLCRGHSGLILNPCCVFARHAREIALSLPMADVLATDITSTWEQLFRVFAWATFKRAPVNFRFRAESVYEARPPGNPLAVCFFGGCGSLTDAALKLAVGSQSRFVVGRACCHENIGMNLRISTRTPKLWNVGHRVKNRIYGCCADRLGHYFHSSAAITAYPMSRTFRELLDSPAMLRCAQHAVDCRLCQAVIDLDRATFLEENGYVLLGHQENMFVAARRGST